MCQELLSLLESMEARNFRNIVTGDESWFTLEFQHARRWSVSRDDVPTRAIQQIATRKFMLSVIWGIGGFHVIDLMTTQCSFNSEYFVNHVMVPLIDEIFPNGRNPHAPRLHVHLDNCRVHFSKATEQFFIQNHLLHVPHPPYSPDLAPSDFWLFGHLKTSLVSQTFESPEDLLEVIVAFLDEIQSSELQIVFGHWVGRIKRVLEHDGEYYHE
jgi:histone-lysine N-methyltransferase SETMAR